ncbi:PTS sugar transporter subunit IIA [Sporolactobacillus shoreae]|uniref:PTS sugar transporter subunit IIA n=1 Tax=Sporolactobacillus shoreae TaxID=1465501 RepID=A0A4Z0GNF7_9BACL|nr:PTS sugar transporter subunit IIA [Sporolactobacillus shoreae]TGA98440.1 PTS sugar transporter subunit IIA [Sporolactobacillus shoreae]
MANEDVQEFDVFFKPDLVFRDVEYPDTSVFFRKIADVLEEKGYVQPTFYQAITKREENYPTGLQTASVGVAIPHADPVNLKKPFISVIRPKNPIEFSPMGGSQDDPKVKAELIFVLGVTRDGLQVKVLQKLMAMLSDESLTDALIRAGSDRETLKIIETFFTGKKATVG